MEHVHGIDVSWMTHGSPKDKASRPTVRRNSLLPQHSRESPLPSPPPSSPPNGKSNGHTEAPANPPSAAPTPMPIPPARPGFTRQGSSEKNTNGLGSSPQRRGSWFSNISSKFASNPGQSPPQATNAPPSQAEISVPRANPARNAVLQHAVKYEGEGPYTPAPPSPAQGSILRVLRRLSSSSGHAGPAVKGTHGLVERRTLNVDPHRERCPIMELDQAKLRRVSFCVDVEIAPLPKYAEQDATPMKTGDKTQKRKLAEKGEGEALKRPKAAEQQIEQDNEKKDASREAPKEPEKAGTEKSTGGQADTQDNPEAALGKAGDTKKKEKKKKSEEERKARKEKRRRLAEANGSIPMEIHLDSDSSTASTPTTDPAPRAQLFPTTNPVRIYRRCCQLRETPILKKITEQLSNPSNFSNEQGTVEKLDLTGYWLQLPDLVTLGDYLAVVPIKEVLLENCGLTDEGLRVVLAGLLAAKKAEKKHRKPVTEADELAHQGGVVERLVLKNNKVGPEGWKHLCLFIYLCRSLKYLDISSLAFPQLKKPQPERHEQAPPTGGSTKPALSICQLLSTSFGERLGGSTLELLNLGDTGLTAHQLGTLMDGIIKCGVKRLGLAQNDIDANGVEHIARYLSSGKCEGLDLGGNDLRDQLEVLANAMTGGDPLWALSLAECGLKPASLCRLFPKLVKLKDFRFIDLSHNHDLFSTESSAISLLRRYLPKMAHLKRIHLADVGMTSEQAIALAEVLPEIPQLAHISLLENAELSKLADARTEEAQEEACALFASLLAATRVSTSIVAVDIDVPTEQSGEIVRAMAKQVVAYCLRNMERLPLGSAALVPGTDGMATSKTDPEYPDVIQHLVGHDAMVRDDSIGTEPAPDDDYVIGGTGVVKALACCLKNRGDDSRRQSGEFAREVESGTVMPRATLPPGKAKDMSKHLLASARKIRLRLQPALEKAKASSSGDTSACNRLLFLESTLDGIIKRFEDEYPDTRESADDAISVSPPTSRVERPLGTSLSEPETGGAVSDVEDETDILPPGVSRSNSVISMSSKNINTEEGRVFRAGHRFRSGWLNYYNLVSGVEEVGADPKHNHILREMLDDLNDEDLHRKAEEKGPVRVFQEDRDHVFQALRAQDPEHWDRFIESQKIARANVKMAADGDGTSKPVGASDAQGVPNTAEEVAVADCL